MSRYAITCIFSKDNPGATNIQAIMNIFEGENENEARGKAVANGFEVVGQGYSLFLRPLVMEIPEDAP